MNIIEFLNLRLKCPVCNKQLLRSLKISYVARNHTRVNTAEYLQIGNLEYPLLFRCFQIEQSLLPEDIILNNENHLPVDSRSFEGKISYKYTINCISHYYLESTVSRNNYGKEEALHLQPFFESIRLEKFRVSVNFHVSIVGITNRDNDNSLVEIPKIPKNWFTEPIMDQINKYMVLI